MTCTQSVAVTLCSGQAKGSQLMAYTQEVGVAPMSISAACRLELLMHLLLGTYHLKKPHQGDQLVKLRVDRDCRQED